MIIDKIGEAAPYNGEPEYSINTEKAKSLGFRFSVLQDWIYELWYPISDTIGVCGGDYFMDNTETFTHLANYYTIGRPAYANTFIESLYSQYGFSEQSVIADIGSGTGKFAKQ